MHLVRIRQEVIGKIYGNHYLYRYKQFDHGQGLNIFDLE